LFVIWHYQGLNSGPQAGQAGALLLESLRQPKFFSFEKKKPVIKLFDKNFQ
jgi:hypothetical protein